MHLTVFDLDHTLLKGNSSFHFGVYLYRQKCFSTSMMLRFVTHYLQHKLFHTPISQLHQKIFSSLFLGRSLKQIEDHAEQFLDRHLEKLLYQPALHRLQEAQQRGDHTVILSSGPHFLVKPIATRLKVNQWDATHYSVDAQQCFSTLSTIIEGEEKAAIIASLAQKLGVLRDKITAYTDSFHDLPLLLAAGKAVGVRPDKRLIRLCHSNRWEIL